MLQNKINQLLQEILSLSSWEERSEYFINLSKTIPEYPAELKTTDRMVKGCQSSAWLDLYEENGRIRISGTANSVFVRGWIHLLILIYDRETISEIHSDTSNFMGQIGFQEMVTVDRGTGLLSIFNRI